LIKKQKTLVFFAFFADLVRTPLDEARIADFKSGFLTKSAKNAKDTKVTSSV
jgi:hypothetical protein